jgi:hypothetical protein
MFPQFLVKIPVLISPYFIWPTNVNQSITMLISDVPRPRQNPKIATLQSIRSLQRDKAALTLEKGRLERSLTSAKAECNCLRETNTFLSAENTLLRQQIHKFGQFNEVCRRFPPLSHHIESLLQSVSMRTPRYSAKMKASYVLVGSMGETLYELFDCHFDFPSWREVERYQAKRRKALGLHKVNPSLSRKSFRSLTREYMPESSDKCVSLNRRRFPQDSCIY